MNKPLHINIPITKIDKDQRMVWGYATVEEVDAHGEIIGYQASKKAFPAWLGNIREMHGSTAIGKSIEIQFDDENKGVWLGSYISESADGENAWIKVKEGILQAYSIGGNINEFAMVKMSDGDDHLMVTDYDLYEVSLVDNPACPSAMLQVIKSVNGKLNHTEKMVKANGAQVPWWMSKFNFSPSQKVIRKSNLPYNNNSMTKTATGDLAKDIYSASQLLDLGLCLADYIWMASWSGTDTTDLVDALDTIKGAAATELEQDENFPDSTLMMAIDSACEALNITKAEELTQMVNSKPNIEKAGVHTHDSDPRNDKAATVAGVEAPPAPVIPAADKVPKNVYAADGVTTTAKRAPKNDEEDNKVDKNTEDGDLAKSQTDLTNSILEGVGQLIEKAVTPLKAEIDALKSQPAVNKRAVTFTDVDKVENDGLTPVQKNKARFDELMEKVNDYAAHPEKGTVGDRVKIGTELRKLSRLMDPASIAQNQAIRNSLPQN